MNLLPYRTFMEAWAAGRQRHRHHCERKRIPVVEARMREEGIGAVAEAFVAQEFGGVWNAEVGRRHYGSDDVKTACGTLEVKATFHQSGRLLVYTDTPDDATMLLVIVPFALGDPKIPVTAAVGQEGCPMRLAGWNTAGNLKKDGWWRADFRTPCWAAPQHALYELETLPCFSRLSSLPAVYGPTTSPPTDTRSVSAQPPL